MKPRDADSSDCSNTLEVVGVEDEQARGHGNRVLSAGELINLCPENSTRQRAKINLWYLILSFLLLCIQFFK